MNQLILYACPTGSFNQDVQEFLKISRERCGRNPAHDYIPHASLTGFFEDQANPVGSYVDILHDLFHTHSHSIPDSILQIVDMRIDEDFIGFELESPWLKDFVVEFKKRVESTALHGHIRPKEWLHLSLAYKFPKDQFDCLAGLAKETVSVSPSIAWKMRLYEKSESDGWICHASFSLDSL